MGMPEISRRANSLGTENAFVVLAEVNALARQGKDIISFCIGQPDFPAPDNVQEAAIRAIKGGKHGYTPSAGIDELRQAAAQYMAKHARRPADPPGGRGGGRRREALHRLRHPLDHRPRRRRRGDLSRTPGFPIYESQIIANGAKPVPIHLHESRNFSFDPAELERLITPKTRLLILNYPHNPTGGCLSRKDLETIAAGPEEAPPGLGLRRRDLFAPGVRQRILLHRPGAGHVRAHHHLRRRLQDLGDDRLAHRLHLEPAARAGLHALDHQHRVLRLADQPVGGGGGDQRAAGCR